jgi:hypothetical protein
LVQTGLGVGVVAGLEGDLLSAGMPVGSFEDEPDRVVHLQRALPRIPLQRQVGDQQRLRAPGASVLKGAAGGRGYGGDARGRGTAKGAEPENPEDEQQDNGEAQGRETTGQDLASLMLLARQLEYFGAMRECC